MMFYYVLAGGLSLIGFFVSGRLKSKFAHYSQFSLRANLNGAEVAERMLRHYGIHDVKITQGQGFLSDHYNPLTKTVNLSPDVYEGRSISAAAVAAHECGHAVQHANAYAWLSLRSAVVPVVNIAAQAQQWLLIIALMGSFKPLILITIAAFAITTTFALITLPVEIDASRRALVWLEESGTARGEEHEGAKDALKWAALTYVSAALSSLVMLVYLVLRYSGSSRN
ncbi:MAG: zinc metallopeptidase [Saprospiraceae bacterium]|nr:zinc metallopeptidase [Saprospiraceae bacterium]